LKPRILFLVPADLAALERKGVAHMILERDEGGFFERVVTAHPLADQRRTIDLNAVHRVIEWNVGRSFAADARLAERLAAPVRFLRMAWELQRVVRTERIDLIRANDPYLMGLLALVLSRLSRIPFCVSIHADYDKHEAMTPKRGIARWARRISRWCPPRVFRAARLVLPIRRHLAEWAVQQGARPQQIRIIPHGVDVSAFQSETSGAVAASFDLEPGVPIVSFVGRLARGNYVFDLLMIAQRVLATGCAQFVIMGDGEERAALEQRVAASALLSRAVRIAGFRAHPEALALRRASAVSICLMGGFSLLEACAAGSPVVAYDVDWHHEVITNGVTGLLVREGDVADAADAVCRLLTDRILARRLGEAARNFIETHHDLRQTSDIKRCCYTALLAST
jgi:glycosyltransferase involved in cell wall biosynthesis